MLVMGDGTVVLMRRMQGWEWYYAQFACRIRNLPSNVCLDSLVTCMVGKGCSILPVTTFPMTTASSEKWFYPLLQRPATLDWLQAW